MESPRVLFIFTEIYPYLPESIISKIGHDLPPATLERGFEIRTFMPRFGAVNERRNQLHEVIRLSGMNLIINETDHPLLIKVASVTSARVQVYFIDNDDYFQKRDLYRDSENVWYPDNDERSVFFARGVLETVRKLRWSPDVIHCHGWFTFLVALYLRRSFKDDPLYANAKIVLSLYDEPSPEIFDESFRQTTLCDGVRFKDLEQMNEPTFENYVKMCLSYADALVAGSPHIDDKYMQYAEENDKALLPYQLPEEYLNKYAELYESLLSRKRRKLWKQ